MNVTSDLGTFLACFFVSTVVLFLVTKSMMESMDFKTILIASVLMTLANFVHMSPLPELACWAIIFALNFIIVKKAFDGTVYFTFLAVVVWIAIQFTFYRFLADGIKQFLGTT